MSVYLIYVLDTANQRHGSRPHFYFLMPLSPPARRLHSMEPQGGCTFSPTCLTTLPSDYSDIQSIISNTTIKTVMTLTRQ